MPIQRRIPDIDKDMANHLRQIDINGWPKSYAVAKKYERYIDYGWVSKGGKITELGHRKMTEYFDDVAKNRTEENPHNRVQPSAR